MPSANPFMLGGGSGGLAINKVISINTSKTQASNSVFDFDLGQTIDTSRVIVFNLSSDRDISGYSFPDNKTIRINLQVAQTSMTFACLIWELKEGSFKSIQRGYGRSTNSFTNITTNITSVNIQRSIILGSVSATGSASSIYDVSLSGNSWSFASSTSIQCSFTIGITDTGSGSRSNIIRRLWNVIELLD